MFARVVGCLVIAACHVTAQNEITRPGAIERIPNTANPIARPPALVLTDAGQLRFVEPLDCPVEEIVSQQHAIEIERGPNLATFVVGVLSTAVGGILLGRGVAGGDGDASNPYTYAGIGALGLGVPLMIGPWIGTGSELREGAAVAPIRRPGRAEPCGERPIAATHATLKTRGIEIFGRVETDGRFAVSPYNFIDAFAVDVTKPWNLTGTVDAAGGARTIEVNLAGPVLAERARAFLADAAFDTKIEPMRIVPNVVPGTLRLSLTSTPDGPAARIVLAVKNDGPGPTYALRGQLAAPGTPALDGRILYFGHIAKGGALSRELLIPVSPAAADALRNATLDVTLELRDAHGTAPTTPVRFRGSVLVDAPR